MSGERPAYVGVNGWHDSGRSDGLSNWRILWCDVAKRWTMQDTNDFFGGIRFFTLVLRGQLIVHILSFYVIVTGAGWGKAWSIFHAFDFSAIQRAIWSSLWGDRLFFEEDMFGRFQQSYWVGRQSRACSGQLIAGLRHATVSSCTDHKDVLET